MNKVYNRINWENYPSDATPLNESNLNKLDSAADMLDDRVITLDTTKATKTEVAALVSDVTFEESTGIITITKKNGSKVTIDTQMEKIAVNFDYDPTTEQIILTLIDGTKQYIDLSALITQYEFLDTDTVAFSIGTDGKVSAIIKEGSVEEKHLEPNYLANVKVEVAKAATSATNAATSEANAKASETAAGKSASAASTSASTASTKASAASDSAQKAESYAVGGTGSRTGEDTDNAKYYNTQALSSKNSASTSATTATNKAGEASKSATSAASSATSASTSATTATTKANAASTSATNAATSEANAKKYYEQAKSISESFAGALRPMGTVSFEDLPTIDEATAGDMYNISDEFTTTDDFKEGAGSIIPAGANIYKTSDGKWDVLAGTPVTGVKGAKEAAYRRGNVSLSAADVGAVAEDGDASDTTVAFSAAAERGNITTGEKLSALFSKIAKWLSDLKPVAFSGSYDDLSNKPTIPANTWRPVQDNLTSTSSTDCLSARMGKYLSENKANAVHYHDGRYYTKTETDTRMAKAMRYVGLYEQEIVLAAGGEFYQAIPSEYQNGGYIYIINCSGNSLNFTGNMEGYNMAVKNRGAATLATRVQVHFFSIGV